jgi:hypothetical protein
MGNPAISLIVAVARHHEVVHEARKPWRRVVLVTRRKRT